MDETLRFNLTANAQSFLTAFNAAERATSALGKGVDMVRSKYDQFNEQVQQMGKRMLIASASMGTAMTLMVTGAAGLESSMRNVDSLVKMSGSTFRETTNDILSLSRTVPASAKEMADGLYDIASSGFEGAEGMTILEQAALGAVAGLSTTATAAKANVAVLNAYGLAAEHSAWVNDILFQTVNVGVLSFEELSGALGNVIGMASTAGVTFEEMSAALAAITLTGLSADEAATSLSRTIQSFIDPSEALSERVRELGYASAYSMLETEGLKGSIEKISESTGGSVEDLNELFNEVRALRGVMALSTNDMELFDRTMASMEGPALAGVASEAFARQAESLNIKVAELTSTLGAIRIELGNYLIPVVKLTTDGLNAMLEVWDVLPGPVKGTIAALMGLTTVMTAIGGVVLLTRLRYLLFSAALSMLPSQITAVTGTAGSLIGVTRNVTSHMAAATGVTGKFGTALQKIPMMMMGPLGLALGAGVVALTMWMNRKADATRRVDQFVEALEADTGAIGENTKALIVNQLEERGILDIMEKRGMITSYLVQGLMGNKDAMELHNMQLQRERELLHETGSTNMRRYKDLVAIQQATKDLQRAQSEAEDTTRAQAEASGELSEADLAVALATEKRNRALGKGNSDLVDSVGIISALHDGLLRTKNATDEMSESVSTLGEEFDDVHLDPHILKLTELKDLSVEVAESLQQRWEEYAKGTKSSFESLHDPFNIHKSKLEEVTKAAEEAGKKEVEAHNDSLQARIDKLRDSDGDHKKEIKRLEEQKKTWEGLSGTVKLSLKDYVKALNNQVKETEKFSEDINRAIERGYDPGLIADLIMQGPEQARPLLDTLLSDQDAHLTQQVNKTLEHLRTLNDEAIQMQRLTNIAINDSNSTLAGELSTAMGIQQEIARTGAEATVTTIADKFKRTPDEIAEIMDHYSINFTNGMTAVEMIAEEKSREAGNKMRREIAAGVVNALLEAEGYPAGFKSVGNEMVERAREAGIDTSRTLTIQLAAGQPEFNATVGEYLQMLLDGLNPMLKGIGRPEIQGNRHTGRFVVSRGGGRVLERAYGGLDEPHTPQIANAGAWRVWAEPETGGEAYIPLANDARRPRAVDIWRETGRRLGVEHFDEGGFWQGSDVPKPPKKLEPTHGDKLGMSADEALSYLHKAVADFVDEHGLPPLGTGEFTGPGIWRMMWDALRRAFPTAALHSAFRPGAITATGNPSYHAQGRAIDVSPRMDINRWIAQNYGARTKELIFSPPGAIQLRNGRPHHYTGITRAMHFDHNHWAMALGGILGATPFANGGIVTKPTLGMVGEAGPEAIIPLAKGGIIPAELAGKTREQLLEEQYQNNVQKNTFRFELGLISLSDHMFNLERRVKRAISAFGSLSEEAMNARRALASFKDEDYRRRMSENDIRFEMGNINASQHLFNLERRLATATKKFGEFSAEAHQARENLSNFTKGMLQNLNDLLDQEAQYVKRRSDLIEGRKDQLFSWMSAEERYKQTWGNSATSLTRNIEDQIRVFEAWQNELESARQRGLSEEVIRMLGLDEGPEALGQLKAFSNATLAEIEELNSAVQKRTSQAQSQAEREASNTKSRLGEEIVEIEKEMAKIGENHGRSYGDAIAQGLQSALPAIRAAATEAQQALQGLATGTYSTKVTPAQVVAMFSAAGDMDWARATRIANEVNSGKRSMKDLQWSAKNAMKKPGQYFHSGTSSVPGYGDVPAVVQGGERIFSRVQNHQIIEALKSAGSPPIVNVEVQVSKSLSDGEVRVMVDGVLRDHAYKSTVMGSR